LVKGGHLTGPVLTDIFLDRNNSERIFESNFINTKNTHGTGCTLSSAIAAYLALGNDLVRAIELGINYVHQAIENGKDVSTGDGHGPLNHFFAPERLKKHLI